MGAKKGVGGEITNFEGKSKKGFLAITLVTVLSILAVIGVYAVIIGTFTGGNVTIGGVSSSTTVTYSLDDVPTETWNLTLSGVSTSTPWYARLEVADNSYSGPVTITWTLQFENGTPVTGATVTTTMVLNGSAEYVYASADGTYTTGNLNWGQYTTTAATYHVVASVDST